MFQLLIITTFVSQTSGNYCNFDNKQQNNGETSFGIHKCPTGHRCVYTRGGKVLDTLSDSGYDFSFPFITTVHKVKTTYDTDVVSDVSCISEKGSRAFLTIKVINLLKNTKECVIETFKQFTPIPYDQALIYDYIPTEVSQFCVQFTIDEIKSTEYKRLDDILLERLRKNIKSYKLDNCVEIKDVLVDPPTLDPEMQQQFEAIEREEKKKQLALKKMETEKVQQDVELQAAKAAKFREQEEAKISAETARLVAKEEAHRQAIIDKKNYDTKESNAKAQRIQLDEQAKGYNSLLTPAYLQLKGYESAHSNAKLIFGDVPQNALMNLGEIPVPDHVHKYLNSTH
jgi:hypothetical protein